MRRAVDQRRRRAFAIVEATLCVLLVAIAFTAAMAAVGRSAKVQAKTGELATARLLAEGLLADFASLPYEDPSVATVSPGVEGLEVLTSKANYNDIDDFENWTESPPQDRNGNEMPGLSGWQRRVDVDWVSPTLLTAATPSTSETGVKRTTITVSRNGVVVLTRVAVRAKLPYP